MEELDDFTTSYIDYALWSSLDDDDEPLDNNWDSDALTKEALAEIKQDCESFRGIPEVAAALKAAYEGGFYDDSQAGGDFWLTRNGHGAGYWDRGLEELGDILTKHARSFGSQYLYATGDPDNETGALHIE